MLWDGDFTSLSSLNGPSYGVGEQNPVFRYQGLIEILHLLLSKAFMRMVQ